MLFSALCTVATLVRVARADDNYHSEYSSPEEIAPTFNSMPKTKIFSIKLLVPQEYKAAFDEKYGTPGALEAAIQDATALAESEFNNSSAAKTDGVNVTITTALADDNPLVGTLTPGICAQGIHGVEKFLGELQGYDSTHRYIAFIPCPDDDYEKVWDARGISEHVVKQSINTECARSAAIMFHAITPKFTAGIINAMYYVMGAQAPVPMIESNDGDQGVIYSITVNKAVESILAGECFRSH